MKSLAAALLVLLTGCAALPPPTAQLGMPPVFEQDGLRVATGGVIFTQYLVSGITGIATNTTARPMKFAIVRLDIVNAAGTKIAEGVASTNGLAPGQSWQFQVHLSPLVTDSSSLQVKPGRGQVFFER